MTDAGPLRTLYLGEGADATFATFHEAAGDPSPSGVVLCPPFGWDEIAAHRALRTWAVAMAARGHHVLRIDPPGTGDAGGSPAAGDRLAAWTESISRAARWLRSQAGCGRVVAVGLGFGGLAACLVAEQGAVDDLVLWAVPRRGKTLVRELRAFAKLNADESRALAGERAATGDDLEVGGFLLNAATIAALGEVDLGTLDLADGARRRALLFERDGIAPDAALAERLRELGLAVQVAPGDGYGRMTSTPQASRSPQAVIAASLDWLGDPGAGAVEPIAEGSPATVTDTLDLGHVRERPVAARHGSGWLYGVVTEPVGHDLEPLRAVLLNAGAVRRTGPGRLWVELARAWAARGVTTLRIDVESVGDSDGDRDYEKDAALYAPELTDTASVALDVFAEHADPAPQARHLVSGLCSGAYWAFHGALGDERVDTALLLNPRALFFREGLAAERDARKMAHVGRGVYWKRLLQGQISLARLGAVLALVLLAPVRVPRAVLARRRERRQVERAYDALRESGKQTVFVFGEDEPLDEELEASGLLQDAARWPAMDLHRLPGRDHTLRPLVTQERLHTLAGEVLEAELARARADQERRLTAT